MAATDRVERAKGPPLVSIVVLSYNRPEYTRATLDALARLTGKTPHEIIVVDNCSERDVQAQLLRWKNGGLIHKLERLGKNRGTAGGYNAGFRAAHPESRFLCKLDNDIKVLKFDWIARILDVFRDVPDAGIVSTDITNHGCVNKLPVFELPGPGGHKLRSWDGWIAGGGGMTFPRALFDMLGAFRDNYREDLKVAPDDFEFFRRVKGVGKQAYYCCAAPSWHQEHLDGQYKKYAEFKKEQYDILIHDVFPKVMRGE